MRLGQKAMEALQAEVTGCLQPGDELVVACPVALGGTSRIAKQEREKLSERFSAGFVCDCMLLQQEYGRWLCRQVQVLSMPWAKGDF